MEVGVGGKVEKIGLGVKNHPRLGDKSMILIKKKCVVNMAGYAYLLLYVRREYKKRSLVLISIGVITKWLQKMGGRHTLSEAS